MPEVSNEYLIVYGGLRGLLKTGPEWPDRFGSPKNQVKRGYGTEIMERLDGFLYPKGAAELLRQFGTCRRLMRSLSGK